MKKQIVLSIEQMKRLEELGLDTSDASMYEYTTIDPFGEGSVHIEYASVENVVYPKSNRHYVYTLQDVLNHLTFSNRHIVINLKPEEWLNTAYILLVSQLMSKTEFTI